MILIINGTLYPMVSEPIKNGAILINDKKIEKVFLEENSFMDIDEKEVTIIDAKGGWVLPGLIDAHCHIGICEDKIGDIGDDINESVNPITPYLSAIDAINPLDHAFKNAIKAGVTSVMTGPGSSNVVGGQFAFIKTYGEVIDDMVVLSPAAMKIAFGENTKDTFSEQGKSPVTRMANAALLREELMKAVKYKKDKENALKNSKDFEVDFKYDCWIPVLNREIPLKAHAHRTDDIMTAIRIAKEFDLDMTIEHGTESGLIAKRIKSAEFPVNIGPGLVSRYKEELRNVSFKTPRMLEKEDILFSIITDHPVCPIQMLPISAGLSVREGLSMDNALKAITINAAKICRVEDRVGSLKEGMDADIAIFDGNPLSTLTKTLYTIINGEIVYKLEGDGYKNGEY